MIFHIEGAEAIDPDLKQEVCLLACVLLTSLEPAYDFWRGCAI